MPRLNRADCCSYFPFHLHIYKTTAKCIYAHDSRYYRPNFQAKLFLQFSRFSFTEYIVAIKIQPISKQYRVYRFLFFSAYTNRSHVSRASLPIIAESVLHHLALRTSQCIYIYTAACATPKRRNRASGDGGWIYFAQLYTHAFCIRIICAGDARD